MKQKVFGMTIAFFFSKKNKIKIKNNNSNNSAKKPEFI